MEIDILRPEVREAIEYLHDAATLGNGTPLDEAAHVRTLRAELLRLADENAQLRDVLADRDMDREMAAHANRRAERAEAELAALKARIAGSRHAFLGPNMDRITFLADEIGPSGKYALVKVEE